MPRKIIYTKPTTGSTQSFYFDLYVRYDLSFLWCISLTSAITAEQTCFLFLFQERFEALYIIHFLKLEQCSTQIRWP